MVSPSRGKKREIDFSSEQREEASTSAHTPLQKSKRRSSRRHSTNLDDAESPLEDSRLKMSSASPVTARIHDEKEDAETTASFTGTSAATAGLQKQDIAVDVAESVGPQPSDRHSKSDSSDSSERRNRSSGGQNYTRNLTDNLSSRATKSGTVPFTIERTNTISIPSSSPSLSSSNLPSQQPTISNEPLEDRLPTSQEVGTGALGGGEDRIGPKTLHAAEATSSSDFKFSKHHSESSRQEEARATLSDSEMQAPSNPDHRRYLLHVLQQPITGCAFGSNLLSRLALAPPLVVQLQAIDRAGREVSIEEEMPFLVCHVHLTTDDDTPADMLSPLATSSQFSSQADIAGDRGPSTTASNTVDTTSTAIAHPPSVRMLYGTLVASPLQLLTIDDRPATIFVFPEISIRSRGRFRLQISLMRVPLPTASPRVTATLANASTDPFSVVLSADYVAPHITDLTRHFARQGVGLLLPPNQTGD
ncbi:hypothetical protein CBS101457_004467 [Exobasidium rhododendri]|nr:hypothetical protein CBS101457_004467 [Exobasidium rhododendri]